MMQMMTMTAAAVAIGIAMAGTCGTASAQGKGKPSSEPTIYPVTITFDDADDRIRSDGQGVYQATMFTGNGTASFDITNSERSVTLDFSDPAGSPGLASAPTGILSASGSFGLIDLGQVGYAPAARYVRITLVGTPYKNDTLAFRKVTGGSSPTVVDGTPVCAAKVNPGVWRVSTLPSVDPAFAGCQTIGEDSETAGEIGAVHRSVKNATVRVANYRMPFSLTVTLDCSLVPTTSTTAAAAWCQ
jgi:hypothetical protein